METINQAIDTKFQTVLHDALSEQSDINGINNFLASIEGIRVNYIDELGDDNYGQDTIYSPVGSARLVSCYEISTDMNDEPSSVRFLAYDNGITLKLRYSQGEFLKESDN